MKKLFTVLAAALVVAAVAQAQPRSLGVRAGYGAELSYQHTLGADNFAELDLGWATGFLSVAGAYNFNIAPVGPLTFYAGPAAHLGIESGEDGGVVLGVGGQLGLEYVFDAIPLQLSLDWRPAFYFVPATAFGWEGLALGIRYCF